MSDDETSSKNIFNLQNVDADDEDDADLIKIQLKASDYSINFHQLYKFSHLIREKYTIESAREELSTLFQNYEQDYSIQERNIQLFFKFIKEETIKVNNSTYFDLFKLSTLFKVKRFIKALSKFQEKHSKEISYIINMIINQESMKKIGLNDNEENNEENMNILIENCNECLKNENFGLLPIEKIKQIIEKPI